MDKKQKISEVIDKSSVILDAFKPVVSALFPKATAPVIFAGKVLDNLKKVDDDTAKNVVFGLSATVIYLNDMLKEYSNSGKINEKGLADNL